MLCYSLAYCRAACFFSLVIIFSLLYAVFLYYRDVFSVPKLRGFLTCSGKVSGYICSGEDLNGIWNYNIICFEFCFVFPPMLFLFSVGGCYAVIVDFDSFSGRTCIFVMLDEQRHLVGHF